VNYSTDINWEDGERSIELVEIPKPKAGESWSVPIGNGDKTPLLYVEPGTFLMGSPKGEKARDKDELQHEVVLTQGYWLGKYEVTQREWEALMGTTNAEMRQIGAQTKDRYWEYFDELGNQRDLYPMNFVSWEDAMEFCKKLTIQERSAGRLGKNLIFTLPTEAQWEYACRAGTTTAVHYGKNLYSDMANFNGNFPYETGWSSIFGYGETWNLSQTMQVGSYDSNAWGLHDMHGNVGEWCRDFYGDYSSDSVSDPYGPKNGIKRVVRGGNWVSYGSNCRSAFREYFYQESRYTHFGFRLALVPAPGFLGVLLDPEYEGNGARVLELPDGYPALRDGIKTGDIIIAVGGIAARDNDHCRRLILSHAPVETVNFEIQRGEKTFTLPITLAAWESQ
jgi:formylglycine-generating enzyme required for sulfatase activity